MIFVNTAINTRTESCRSSEEKVRTQYSGGGVSNFRRFYNLIYEHLLADMSVTVTGK
jgi:hypothetical protein